MPKAKFLCSFTGKVARGGDGKLTGKHWGTGPYFAEVRMFRRNTDGSVPTTLPIKAWPVATPFTFNFDNDDEHSLTVVVTFWKRKHLKKKDFHRRVVQQSFVFAVP